MSIFGYLKKKYKLNKNTKIKTIIHFQKGKKIGSEEYLYTFDDSFPNLSYIKKVAEHENIEMFEKEHPNAKIIKVKQKVIQVPFWKI